MTYRIAPLDTTTKRALKAEVQSEIFCPVTGTILDMRTAVLIAGPRTVAVVSPEGWDRRKEAFAETLAADFTVYNAKD